MSDTFLPGSGFDTYESQDKVLVQMDGSRECAVAVRILQQQGFAVAGAAVRLTAEQTADAESAKKAAEIIADWRGIETPAPVRDCVFFARCTALRFAVEGCLLSSSPHFVAMGNASAPQRRPAP